MAANASFNLTNNADVAAKILATSGDAQSTVVNTAFANSLVVKVTDKYDNPINNSSVTFSVPSSGASGIFTGGVSTLSVTTDATGMASVPISANTVAGKCISTGSVAGVAANASFNLTNSPEVQQPVIDPVVQQPVIPVVQQPVIDPVVQQPVIDPVVQQPVIPVGFKNGTID